MAYRKKSFFRKKRSFKKRVSMKKRPLRKFIKKVVSRQAETKTKEYRVGNNPLYYPLQGGLYDVSNTLAMTPTDTTMVVSQGAGAGQRIGNKISVKKLTFRGHFIPQGYIAATNPTPEPLAVRLILFTRRTTPTVSPSAPTNGVRNDFFQFGNSVEPLTGTITDIAGPVNKDVYRVFAQKSFKLGFADYIGTNTNPDAQAFSNNDFKLLKYVTWDLTKYIPKLMRYNDANAGPLTRGLWMQAIVTPALGTQGAAGVIPCQVRYWLEMKYQDM